MAAVIRLATPSDAAAISGIYRPAVVDSAISFELEPPTPDEMAARVASTLARTPWLVCDGGRGITGYAYAGRHRERPAYQWSVEVSAYVHDGARRSGVASALYESLFAVLALQGFRSAYAGITLPNDASVALHRRCGFTPVGVFRKIGYKHGAWHDVAWLERPLAPYDLEPASPIPLPSLAPDAVERALATGLSRLRVPST